MRMARNAWLFSSILVSAGFGSAQGKIDPCALISSDEIKAVQGEGVVETKGSERSNSGLIFSQCFYRTGAFVKSVSLELTQRNAEQPGKRDPRSHWQDLFHGQGATRPEGNRGAQARGEKDKEEKLKSPQPVRGVGEEAYWVGNRMVGVLYVLRKDAYFRVSIGGWTEESLRMRKTVALARKVLKRL